MVQVLDNVQLLKKHGMVSNGKMFISVQRLGFIISQSDIEFQSSKSLKIILIPQSVSKTVQILVIVVQLELRMVILFNGVRSI